MPHYQVSRCFKVALKLGSTPAYRVAVRTGVNPSTLSKLVTGATPVQPEDPRIIAVGRALGLAPEDCIEEAPEDTDVLRHPSRSPQITTRPSEAISVSAQGRPNWRRPRQRRDWTETGTADRRTARDG